MNSETSLAPLEGALIAAAAANEKKASDIVVAHVGELISVTDYFVIVTARNDRQAQAIIDEIEERLRDRDLKVVHRELTPGGAWSLLDYGSFIVHVFQPEAREHYRLEALWEAAPIVDLTDREGFEDLEYSERIHSLIERASSRDGKQTESPFDSERDI